MEARVAELEAEVTDLGAARARLLKLEESIRKHLGEFCGRPDEVTTVGQILTTVKEKLRRLQKSRAHQAGAAIAARDEREALLSAVDERLGPTWAADLDQLAAALGGCEHKVSPALCRFVDGGRRKDEGRASLAAAQWLRERYR